MGTSNTTTAQYDGSGGDPAVWALVIDSAGSLPRVHILGVSHAMRSDDPTVSQLVEINRSTGAPTSPSFVLFEQLDPYDTAVNQSDVDLSKAFTANGTLTSGAIPMSFRVGGSNPCFSWTARNEAGIVIPSVASAGVHCVAVGQEADIEWSVLIGCGAFQ